MYVYSDSIKPEEIDYKISCSDQWRPTKISRAGGIFWDFSILSKGGHSFRFPPRGGDAPSVLEVPPIKFVVNIIVGLYLSISTVHMLAVIDDMRHPSIIIEPLV